MIRFGKAVVKARYAVLILAVVLLIPAFMGMQATRVNYDVLTYLPGNLETVQGQDILVDEFGMGGFAMVVVENMPDKDVVKLEQTIEAVDNVKEVLWYDDVLDISVPKEMLPEEIREAFDKGNATMMIAILTQSTSSDESLEAIDTIQKICDKQCFVSGATAVVNDTRNLSDKEVPIYVALATLLSLAVLMLTTESWLVPILFLLSIGMAIVYNLGSNIFLGQISYITKALSAVLQLGVTMDYSIFLFNSYEENKKRFGDDKNRAMAHAISNTFQSVVGSSITTIAGFIALCFMSFTLGLDIGIVMSKGVLLGVICCVTVLPSMILILDKPIEKLSHKPIMPDLSRISRFVTKHAYVWLVLFLILLFPALYGNHHTGVYYNISDTLPENLPSSMAAKHLSEDFDMHNLYMVMLKKSDDLDFKTRQQILREIGDVDGVTWTMGIESLVGPGFPEEMLPGKVRETLENEDYELQFVCSAYDVATEEMNRQISTINDIVKRYDRNSMIVGEAPLTRDLVSVTDTDFKHVNFASVFLVFAIIACVFKSASLPFILVAVIEFAINVNMGIPFYTGTQLPFIASIVIGTIQLGSTVDYAILMTSKYQKARSEGHDKKEAVSMAHSSSMRSILISGCAFFAATFGVGLYSEIDMISALCTLLARGALVSTVIVVLLLPSFFLVFDPLIVRTSYHFLGNKGKKKSKSSNETVIA